MVGFRMVRFTKPVKHCMKCMLAWTFTQPKTFVVKKNREKQGRINVKY